MTYNVFGGTLNCTQQQPTGQWAVPISVPVEIFFVLPVDREESKVRQVEGGVHTQLFEER